MRCYVAIAAVLVGISQTLYRNKLLTGHCRTMDNVRFGSKADSFWGQNPKFNLLIGLVEHSANK